ncbi:hypothetical protein MKEN_00474600 [Mycena kentingensis (nom. inval.)]|nr:hypothetical protein MKEN_00474600 [Mycena kentingensis (nom. inval.)]
MPSRSFLTLLFALCRISAPAVAQLAGQTVRIDTILTGGADGTTGDCLTATRNADGAAVVIQDCGTNATQLNSWTVPNGVGAPGPLKIFGDKCLDVKDGLNADGTKLQIWTCDAANANQMWVPGGSGNTIAWSGKNKCVDLPNGNTTDGNVLQVWTCDSNNNNQRFNAKDVNQPKTTTIMPKKDTSKCVTASSHNISAPVVIAPCAAAGASSAEQSWVSPIQGMLAVPNAANASEFLCIQPLDDKITTDGAKLVLEPCDLTRGKAGQLWFTADGGENISNGGFAKMLMDLTDGSTATGNQLQIWFGSIFSAPPNGGDNINQDWVFKYTF